jgi:putative FmdB family regulatory protein
MPLFEFDCDDCAQPFEKLVRSVAAVDAVVCPNCGSSHVERKISTFAVKGTSPSSSASSTSCSPGGL